MKKRILLFTVIAGISAFAISSYQNGPARNGYDCTGAESAGTGSFVNYTGCQAPATGCHNTTATTTIGVTIELDSAGGIATTHYKPGLTYTVKISGDGTSTSNTHYGFQLNALKGTASAASNANAGTWASTGLPAGTRLTTPGTFTQLTCMEHSGTLTGATFTQSFTWTAPVAGTGTISFWGAANFVNNDGNQNASDLWNTNHVTIAEWPATSGVGNVTNNVSIKAFPNPVINNLSLQMDNVETGTYSVLVFDITGKTIATDNIVVNGTSHTSNINTGSWLPGNYHVVIEKDGNKQVIPVVKF